MISQGPSAFLRRQFQIHAGILLAFGSFAAVAQDGATPEPRSRPDRNRPGPWNNDVVVYRAELGKAVERLATFTRAGVATLTRLKDGSIAAAFQHFPENDERHFDRVAVCFSRDEGRTWTAPQPISVSGMEAGLMRPFDPTLVSLPDGRVRIYFTSNRSPDFRRSTPAIYSAISTNAVDYTFEPGVRFGVEGRVVIDCAVVLHRDVYHLFAPDNGSATEFKAAEERRTPTPGGVGYHATSKDGLTFTREADVRLDSSFRWLGNAQSDGDVIRFFGTGGRAATATSTNGREWTLDNSFPRVPGADPGAVKLRDGGWLIVATGPPRDGRTRSETTPRQAPIPPIVNALDANGDHMIDAWELENATALLRKLDRNGDGRLSADELRPATEFHRSDLDSPAPRRERNATPE